MRIFDRYIGRQIVTATLIAVSVLSVIMVLGNIVRKLLSLPTEILREMPAMLLLKFVGYALTASLPFTVPWSLLTAVLLVFGRMSADNELLAIRMAGNSFLRICAPVLGFAALLSALCFWINLQIAPLAQSEIFRLPTMVATDNPKKLLSADRVIDQIDDFIIFIGSKKNDDELRDFQMIMMGPKKFPIGYISARRVKVSDNREERGLDLDLQAGTLILRDEERDEQDAGHGPRVIQEIRAPISIGQVTQTATLRSLYEKLDRVKPGMMGTLELSQKLEEENALARAEAAAGITKGKGDDLTAKERASGYRTELNKRFSFSLACLVFVIIGAPLGVTAQRRETSVGFAISLVVGISYIAFLLLGDSILKDNPKAMPWLVVWLPNVVFLALGLWLFRRLQKK